MSAMACGQAFSPGFSYGELPHAPSAVDPETDVFTTKGMTKTVAPHAMTLDEINNTILDYRKAAENAMRAGFDGIEIHSSNGYLIHQFFSNSSNKRTDEYGGSDENKAKFFFQVLDAIKGVVPENKIAARLNPMLNDAMGIKVDEETAGTFDYIVERLNSYDLAYLHLSRPWVPLKESWFIQDVIGHYRKIYKGFLVANANYTPESGEAEVREGRADAIAFGRPFIANPDLPARIENNWPLASPDSSTFYTGGEKGYIDYPVFDEKLLA